MKCLGFGSFAEINAYLTFVLLGMSIMMVVSAIMSAPSFMGQFYIYATGIPNAKPERPLFWDNINVFYNVGTYATQFLCEMVALTSFMRRLPLQFRFYCGQAVMLAEMLLLIIVPAVTIPTQDGAIAMLMLMSVMGGFSKALVDSTANALVGPFPTKFMNGEQWGLTVVALFMSVLQCILKVSMGTSFTEVLKQSRIYFGIGMLVQLLATFEVYIMPRNTFAQKYAAEYRVKASKAGGESSPMCEGANGGAVAAGAGPVEGDIQLDESDAHHKDNPLDNEPHSDRVRAVGGMTLFTAVEDADNMRDLDQNGKLTSSDQMLRTSVLQVIRKVWPMLLCTFMVFFTTMLVFPGIFFKVKGDDWYGIIVVLLFNVGDFVSRMFLMYRPLRPSPKMAIIGAFSRLSIIPLLVVCACGYIHGVALPYVLITLLGFSNGYFGTMAMIHCPRTPTLTTACEGWQNYVSFVRILSLWTAFRLV